DRDRRPHRAPGWYAHDRAAISVAVGDDRRRSPLEPRGQPACRARTTFPLSERALRISVFSVYAALAAGFALSGCATGTTVTQSGEAANGVPTAPVSGGQRDL